MALLHSAACSRPMQHSKCWQCQGAGEPHHLLAAWLPLRQLEGAVHDQVLGRRRIEEERIVRVEQVWYLLQMLSQCRPLRHSTAASTHSWLPLPLPCAPDSLCKGCRLMCKQCALCLQWWASHRRCCLLPLPLPALSLSAAAGRHLSSAAAAAAGLRHLLVVAAAAVPPLRPSWPLSAAARGARRRQSPGTTAAGQVKVGAAGALGGRCKLCCP